jgi:hypothetical protein
MDDIFDTLNMSYPRSYGSRVITKGGCTDIKFPNGACKSLDFSLYEHHGVPRITDSTPTIVFEVSYSQSTQSLAIEAARHVCLTLGQI